MKKIIFPLLFALLSTATAIAQVYHDMSGYPVYGTLAPDAKIKYSRLPDSLSTRVNDKLWALGQNSAGLSIRFATDATSIYAKWTSRNNFNMNHMAPTGVQGIDLYVQQPDGTWTYAATGIPSKKAENSATLIKDMAAGGMREYMLFLPLYDGVTSLSIGTNKGAMIQPSVTATPLRKKPVVMYGTSIMQGGCASRPGMAHTNILQRMLNREVVNLGFSGAGKLDPEIAQLMAQSDAALFVIDVLPNNTIKSLNEKLEPFYRTIRAKHPATPIILVENAIPPRAKFDSRRGKEVKQLNQTLRDFYNRMLDAGDSNLYYFEGSDILGIDGEGTVDGIHLTDLGFKHFAEAMYPLLEVLLAD